MKTSEQFPVIAHRGHRPLNGKQPRVMIGGAMVSPDTKYLHVEWTKRRLTSKGETHDAVYAFAKAKGFAKLSVKPTIKTR